MQKVDRLFKGNAHAQVFLWAVRMRMRL